MTVNEGEAQPQTPFGREAYTETFGGDREYTFQRLTMNPDLLEGFDVTNVSREVVASVVLHTIRAMEKHGASALGLDLDSMAGRVHASGHLLAAMSVGVHILDDLAPRTDSLTWREWLGSEFPNAVAAVHGVGSDAQVFAQQEMTS